jgi:hypothetical protein
MAVENGRSLRLPVNQDGRGHEPVTVVGRIRSFVAVSTLNSLRAQCERCGRLSAVVVPHAPATEFGDR